VRVTVDELLDRLERVRKTRRGWTARCPAHEDRNPSLSVAEGDDGRVLLRCWTGCTVDKITAALGLELADLFPGRRDTFRRWTPRTPEERLAAENRRLRREVRVLELEQRKALLALGRACLLIGIAYSDDPETVLDRLWQGAVERLEQEAAEAADAYVATEVGEAP
jgi:hypothetical protein